MPGVLAENLTFQQGAVGDALTEVFFGVDNLLRKPEYRDKLRALDKELPKRYFARRKNAQERTEHKGSLKDRGVSKHSYVYMHVDKDGM